MQANRKIHLSKQENVSICKLSRSKAPKHSKLVVVTDIRQKPENLFSNIAVSLGSFAKVSAPVASIIPWIKQGNNESYLFTK